VLANLRTNLTPAPRFLTPRMIYNEKRILIKEYVLNVGKNTSTHKTSYYYYPFLFRNCEQSLLYPL